MPVVEYFQGSHLPDIADLSCTSTVPGNDIGNLEAYVCMHAYMCIYTYIHMYMYVYIDMEVYVHISYLFCKAVLSLASGHPHGSSLRGAAPTDLAH